MQFVLTVTVGMVSLFVFLFLTLALCATFEHATTCDRPPHVDTFWERMGYAGSCAAWLVLNPGGFMASALLGLIVRGLLGL
jgi:hypothetical protein